MPRAQGGREVHQARSALRRHATLRGPFMRPIERLLHTDSTVCVGSKANDGHLDAQREKLSGARAMIIVGSIDVRASARTNRKDFPCNGRQRSATIEFPRSITGEGKS